MTDMSIIVLHGVTLRKNTSYSQSENHPDPTNASELSTSSASRAISTDRPADVHSGLTKCKKAGKSLTIYDVSQIAAEKGIRTRLQLLAYANRQKKEGKADLGEFIANRGTKAVEEAPSNGWELEESEEKAQTQ